ncbi:MAG: hypothetical protein RLZZ28_235, partial [Bacteroidota bacterium]
AVIFLAKLAFICNILFLYCLVIQHTRDFLGWHEFNATVITLGWLLAPFVNLAANISSFWLVLKGRKKLVPFWLLIVNFLFLLVEFFVHFILPK